MFDYLLSDLERKRNHYFLEDTFFEKYVKTTLQLGTIAAFYYRFGHWAASRKNIVQRNLFLFIYYCLSPLIVTVTQIHISPKLLIGKGFIIHNFSNIVIDAESVGDNFTVNQGVSIGSDWQQNGKPAIGDNVFIGSGAKVLGHIKVGSNVVVAANALVIKSVPDNCTVAGVPARIISRDTTSNYLHLGTTPNSDKAPQSATTPQLDPTQKSVPLQPMLSALVFVCLSAFLTACGGSHAPASKSAITYAPVPDTACGTGTIAATALSSDIRFIDPVNLSDAGGLSEHPSIATGPNGRVYVAWDEDKDLNKEIYFRESRDYGSTYSDYFNVSNTGAGTIPSIGVDGDATVHVAWQDVTTGPSEIRYARKRDGESAFSASVQISAANAVNDNATQSVGVFLAVAPSNATQGPNNVYAVWSDDNQLAQAFAVHVVRSTDGGDSFSTDLFNYTPPDNAAATSTTSHVDVEGNLHIAWVEAKKSGGRDLKYVKSTNQGTTFSTPIVLYTTESMRGPSIATDRSNPSNIYVVWDNDGLTRAQLIASHDGGQTFGGVSIAVDTTINSTQLTPRLASGVDGTVYLALTDNRTGNYETAFAKSTDHGATFTQPVVFSPSAQGSLFVAIAVDDENNIYIGADDNRFSNPPDTPEEIGNEGNFEILVARGKQGLPAVQSALASPCPVTPNGDNDADITTFSGEFSEPLNWTLVVLAPDESTIVYQQTGTGASMTVTWDGKSDGITVADGVYTYMLSGTNATGVASTGATGLLVIYTATDEAVPVIKSFSREAFGFSPNGDGFKDSDGISAEFNKPLNWTVTITDSNSVVQRTMTGSGVFIDDLVTRWDGKDESGNILPEANYTVNVSAVDSIGQTASCGRQPFPCLTMEIDTTQPFIDDLQLDKTSFNPDLGTLTITGVPHELSLVTIYVYNQVGVLVRKVDRNFRDADVPFSVTWDGLNSNNQRATPGDYVVYVWCRDRSGNTAPTYPYLLDFTVQ